METPSHLLQRCGSCKGSFPLDAYSPSYRGKVGTWCRPCFAAYHRGERQPQTHEPQVCVVCSTWYVPHQLKTRAAFCSPACKGQARHVLRQAAINEAKPKRRCLHCNVVIGPARRADAKFCSESCNSSAHQQVRRFAQRGSTARRRQFLRASLAVRDRWRCGLCHRPVSKTLRHPDPQSLSIDHLVSLAKGGTNDWSNLHIAHLVCNLKKGAA